MSRYSLWLERYTDKKELILQDLRRYKAEIEKIREEVRAKNLILPVKESSKKTENLDMCFVDGGEGLEELLGCAIYYIRASGLVMKHRNDRFVRDLDVGILKHNENTKDRVDLLRSIMELDVAERCIKEHSPEYVFLDGSLYVNAMRREVQCPEYDIFRKKFSRLLKASREKGVRLCGVSEDSASRLLINHLAAKDGIRIPGFMTDSSLLKFISDMREGRFVTREFTPESSFGFQNNSHSVSFPTVYLQPTRISNPLRVDVPDWEGNFQDIISVLVKLSKGSKGYGYPCPLYIVHMDAKIEKKHSEWNTMRIVHHITKEDRELYETVFRKRRRDSRPGEGD